MTLLTCNNSVYVYGLYKFLFKDINYLYNALIFTIIHILCTSIIRLAHLKSLCRYPFKIVWLCATYHRQRTMPFCRKNCVSLCGSHLKYASYLCLPVYIFLYLFNWYKCHLKCFLCSMVNLLQNYPFPLKICIVSFALSRLQFILKFFDTL